MSNRLNPDRETKLQPKRIEYAVNRLHDIGILNIQHDHVSVWFIFKGALIKLYPYSGWFTGKTVKDGRGIDNLLQQLKAL